MTTRRGSLRFGVWYIILALGFMTCNRAHAIYQASFEGKTTVTVERAPIRAGWDAARIIGAADQGQELNILGLGGHGNGSWLKVDYVKGGKTVSGFIDVRQTNFWEDVFARRVKQPSN
jgi:hypothetical protein